MVRWRRQCESRNVDDRRRAVAAGGGAGLLVALVRMVVGRFGIRGLVVLGVAAAGLYAVGANPLGLVGGGDWRRYAPTKRRTARDAGKLHRWNVRAAPGMVHRGLSFR